MQGERTAGVIPPRDVNELLDVTDLLGLDKLVMSTIGDVQTVLKAHTMAAGRVLCRDRLLFQCPLTTGTVADRAV